MLTVEETILRDLGKKKVRFAYPGVEGVLQGTLKDRCVLAAGNNIGGVPYWDVIDLIEFEGQSEPDFMRIGYYRKPLNRLSLGEPNHYHRTALDVERLTGKSREGYGLVSQLA